MLGNMRSGRPVEDDVTRLAPLCGLLVVVAFGPAVAAADPFETFLQPPFPAAEGFSTPFDEGGIVVAIDAQSERRHRPGLRWSPRGGAKNTPLRAPAHGRVVEAGERHLVLEHLVYENVSQSLVRTTLEGSLATDLRVGALVQQGQQIGSHVGKGPVTLFVEAGRGERARFVEPRSYLATHRKLFVPRSASRLLVVHHGSHRMRIYERGVLVGEREIALGQGEGAKERRGDNRTPVGLYRIVSKSTGPFEGPAAPWFGGYWMKLNYPNPWDAERGVAAGLITQQQRERIERAWRAGEVTPQQTALGGGIGFHGWAGEWRGGNEGAHLSWGCVVMHTQEIAALYPTIETGTWVALLE